MVIQKTIDNLRERPDHERRAVAFGVAVGVVVILFLAWGVFFIQNMKSLSVTPLNSAYQGSLDNAAAAAAAGNTGWVSTLPPTSDTDPSDGGQLQVIEQTDEQTLQ